MCSIKRKF